MSNTPQAAFPDVILRSGSYHSVIAASVVTDTLMVGFFCSHYGRFDKDYVFPP